MDHPTINRRDAAMLSLTGFVAPNTRLFRLDRAVEVLECAP